MATPEGQTIINGLKGLINQVVGIKSDIARVLSAISLLNSLITEGFATIRAAINGIVEIILQLIRSLFGNGDSIDYDRIFEIVHSAHRTTRDLISSAHQATREIIVNQLYAKIEAGFANLESLIKSLKLSVDYDRIAGIVNNAVNGLGDLIISSHQATREIISNSINSAHQTTREVIVNILSPKLEAGFANLESLIKSLKLSVDYDRIAGIVNNAVNGLGDLIISSHQTTRQVITGILDNLPGTIINTLSLKLNAILAKLDALKSTVDYDKIKGIVDGAHNFTRGIILAALGGITAAVAAAIGALVPVFTAVVETAAATIALAVRQAAAQLAVQLEGIIRRLLRDPSNNSNDSINWQNVTVPVVSCDLGTDGKYTPSTTSQTITVIATKSGNEASKTLKHFQELAKSNEQLCRNRNNEAVALVALPERYELSPGGHIPQMIYVFKQVNDDNTLGRVPYQITVPHPANTTPPTSPPLPNYKKGSWEAILTLKDNSKVFVNAYSVAEGEAMLDAIKPLINSSFLVNSFQKVGQRKGQALLEINVKLVEMQYYSTGTALKEPDWIKRF